MANTATKPWILAISLDHKPFLDDMFEPLMAKIRRRADFLRVEDADSAKHWLSRATPEAILITDEGLTEDQNSHVWHAVLRYVRGGGTAVVMGCFSNFVLPLSIKPFFAQAGLEWCSASYTGETFVLNDAAVDSCSAAKMVPEYSTKAQFLNNVALGDAWYVTDEESNVLSPINARAGESAVAFASVGDGKLGYIGDVNAEHGSNVAVLAMCGLL
ncbi:triacylglycerol lipase [Fusarium subglutinans]|uniref:Triacylglycerol lipase n=1 Tax=Gibberella subglutinans TaxID=42677 RepID=A0A8H5P8K6_GIBSU|nr:triacylglycerol lipase [Fusarium subglutinans]KAF5591998.1 triacylglycerol lipase [Fusarium subglutinans]